MNYQRILLDADGTLFDFNRCEKHSFFAACEDVGIAADLHLYERYRAFNIKLWKQLELGAIDQPTLCLRRFEQVFATENIHADIHFMNQRYSYRLSQCTFLIDGALELCQKLHGLIPLEIVTNGTPDVQKPRIEKSPLAPYIDHIFISGELGYQKPHPGFFDSVFDQLDLKNIPRKQIILLGDSLSSDMLGGHNYGLTTCLFSPNNEQKNETCDYQIRHLLDFYPLVTEKKKPS